MTRSKLIRKSILLFLLLINLTVCTFGQYDAITKVKFGFWHSLRIPNHHVTVDLQRLHDTVTVRVTSTPSQKSPRWDSTKRNYSFKIATTNFDKVVTLVKAISSSDVVSQSAFSGNDGTSCTIEFGGYGSTIEYSIWSPDFATKERKLQAFLDACRLILQTARLDPDKIL